MRACSEESKVLRIERLPGTNAVGLAPTDQRIDFPEIVGGGV